MGALISQPIRFRTALKVGENLGALAGSAGIGFPPSLLLAINSPGARKTIGALRRPLDFGFSLPSH
jgi:hypothetical protein